MIVVAYSGETKKFQGLLTPLKNTGQFNYQMFFYYEKVTRITCKYKDIFPVWTDVGEEYS